MLWGIYVSIEKNTKSDTRPRPTTGLAHRLPAGPRDDGRLQPSLRRGRHRLPRHPLQRAGHLRGPLRLIGVHEPAVARRVLLLEPERPVRQVRRGRRRRLPVGRRQRRRRRGTDSGSHGLRPGPRGHWRQQVWLAQRRVHQPVPRQPAVPGLLRRRRRHPRRLEQRPRQRRVHGRSQFPSHQAACHLIYCSAGVEGCVDSAGVQTKAFLPARRASARGRPRAAGGSSTPRSSASPWTRPPPSPTATA